jgi:uncharacterized protein
MQRRTAESVPIFPLAQVVLFPRVRVPLFIFEPRYRQMIRDALAGSKRIGMVCIRPEGVADAAGDPPVFDVGCEGIISNSLPHSDGTWHITLDGTRRFRILEEDLPNEARLYRVARIDPLVDAFPESDRLQARAIQSELIQKLERLLEGSASEAGEGTPTGLFEDVDPAVAADALAQTLALSAVEKQGLLEAESVVGRLRQLDELLDFRIAALAAGGGTGDGGVLH